MFLKNSLNNFGKDLKLHFIGIGGSGMSGLAEVFHTRGYNITGSDEYKSDATKKLESMGIKKDDKAWYEGVLKLLENHSYHTSAAKELRDDKKKENIEKLKQIIASIH